MVPRLDDEYSCRVCLITRLTTSPSHGQRSINASTIRIPIGSSDGRTSIAAEQRDTLWLVKWKRAILILQQNGRCRSDLADNLGVVILHVDMLVQRPTLLERVEIDGWVPFILADEEEARHDSDGHVVYPGERHRPIVDCHREVGAKVRVVRVERDVSGHCLI